MPDPKIILDAHLDIAYNTLLYGRDFTVSAYRQRQLEEGQPWVESEGIRTAALPEALIGRVGLTFGTLYVSPARRDQFFDERVSYRTPEEAYQRALAQLDVYQQLADSRPNVRLVRNQGELTAVLETWREGRELGDHCFGIVVLMEGADPIVEPRQFEEWYERGVRLVGPAWSGTRYSGGTGAPGPLTALGRELLEVMASFNAVLDLSHMAEEAFLESVDRYPGTVIASHSNARKFCDTDRHLSDVMIRRLAERDGVMGIPIYNRFLKGGWKYGVNKKEEVTLHHVVAAIDHVCQLTGSAQHVGIGTDLDGGFGMLSTPAEIDTIADLRLIEPLLQARGYPADDIARILAGNFLRILNRTLPA